MDSFAPSSVVPIYDNRDFEDLLLESLPQWSPGAPPVRVVVSSESLRRHWIRRIAVAHGAVLGVEVVTHTQYLRQFLRASSLEWRNRPLWIDHRIRAIADEMHTLRSVLGSLENGYGIVTKAIVELRDAGFEPGLVEAMLESVQAWPRRPGLGVGSQVAPRVTDLIRVAERLDSELEQLPASSMAQAVRAAVEVLREKGDVNLPSSMLVFIGFCDATGSIADLLEAARRYADGVLTIEVPARPTNPQERDPGAVFAQPYHSRFEAHFGAPVGVQKVAKAVSWSRAVDPYQEAQEVAQLVLKDLDAGIAPEDIGVVVRSFTGWETPLRRALSGSAIPYSAIGGAGLGGAEERRVGAIVSTLLLGRDAVPAQWLTACGQESDARGALAMDEAGVRTLQEIPERFGSAEGRIRLSASAGIAMVEGQSRRARASLSGKEVEGIRRRALCLLDVFTDWPETAPAAVHWEHLGRSLKEGLAVKTDHLVMDVLRDVSEQIVPTASLSQEEVIRLFTSALVGMDRRPLGGAGGGVALLDATEARGRTFSRLYVLGLNRGEFPRMVREDPLLPDAARRALRVFLPDLREKKIGVQEERFLFAQLISASDHVHLSCSERDIRGSENHPSSLLVELQLESVLCAPIPVTISTAQEWEAGVHRGVAGGSPVDALTVAGGHQSIIDLNGSREAAFGAYCGNVGPVVLEADSRRRDLFVTAVEAVARCPWSAFMGQHLGVRDRPDPRGALPSVSGHLLGRVVHQVIERVVEAAVGAEPRQGADDAVSLAWPSASTLEAWIVESADECLRADGVGWRGFSRAVVGPAAAALSLLRELDGDLQGVWASEAEFKIDVGGCGEIAFKADRLDVVDGRPTVTDFKLGRLPTNHKKPETREKKILEAVRAGRLLQGPLYARTTANAVGRYLYINPDHEGPVRSFEFSSGDTEIQEALDAVVAEVRETIATGAFFPRVSEARDDKIPSACEYCTYREACIVGDSGLRRRLLSIMKDEPANPAEEARLALWWRGDEVAP